MSGISRNFLLTVVLLAGLTSLAQESLDQPPADSFYREDQFYISITYNIPVNLPEGVVMRGLTGGVHFGFLRDMPINKKRNLAIALGAGLAIDQFGQNLFIGETEDEKTVFQVLNADVDYERNRFNMAAVEIPVEFRWRTSTASSYNFWRVYAGFKLGYAYWYKSTFKQSGNNVFQTDIPEFEPLRLSATLSFGYSTFNLFASYGLNPFFKDAMTEDNQPLDFSSLKVGLIFYIL